MIIAHRGYRKHHQENTIASFAAAFAAGADAVETDVRLTADGQAVASHNNDIILGGRALTISRTHLSEIIKLRGQGDERLLTIDELFAYLSQTAKSFFLEVKQGAPLLAERIVSKIKEYNLWERAHIMGFWRRNRAVLAAQKQYPRLRVLQILGLPLFSYLKPPPKSFGLFLGWLPAINISRFLFQGLISRAHLRKLRRFYETRNFKVIGGLLNSPDGWDLFSRAGITDVVTDNVPAAVDYFKERFVV